MFLIFCGILFHSIGPVFDKQHTFRSVRKHTFYIINFYNIVKFKRIRNSIYIELLLQIYFIALFCKMKIFFKLELMVFPQIFEQ